MSIENGCNYYFDCKTCANNACLVVKQKAEIERLKIDLENEKNWGKIQKRQAIKETAKDIYDKCIAIDKATGSNGFVCIEAIAELSKSKGVEVE